MHPRHRGTHTGSRNSQNGQSQESRPIKVDGQKNNLKMFAPISGGLDRHLLRESV